MTNDATNLDDIKAVLAEVQDPESGRSILQMDQVHDVALHDGTLKVVLGLTTFSAPVWKETQARIVELIQSRFPAIPRVEVSVERHERAPAPLGEIGLRAKAVIAVGSGKGGVGKSTIAASIA